MCVQVADSANANKKTHKSTLIILCPKCGRKRTHEAFGLCASCSHHEWKVKQNAEWWERERKKKDMARSKVKERNLEYLKTVMELKCVHCGYDRFFEVLQSHHTNPSQKEKLKDTLSKWLYGSLENLKKKLAQHDFILLCANCHTEEHLKEGTKTRKGGPPIKYFPGGKNAISSL